MRLLRLLAAPLGAIGSFLSAPLTPGALGAHLGGTLVSTGTYLYVGSLWHHVRLEQLGIALLIQGIAIMARAFRTLR